MADSPLTASLAALARFFVGDGTVHQTLQRVSDLLVESLPAAEMAGITMVVEGRERTAVFTDEAAPEIDQAQYDSGDGPCVTALREARVTQIDATSEPGEWPEFRRAAAARGIGSTLSFPLLVDKEAVGAMNLYSRHERAFSEEDHETGELFAAQAAIVLANAQAYWDAHELSVRLGEAMKNRAVIEQAKGMLMAAEGCDDEEAFAMLVSASQRENVKLRQISLRIVQAARRPDKDDGGGSGDEQER